MRGEFPETLCIEQGVVLSCRFAESKVRWTSRVLWMAVVSQSSKVGGIARAPVWGANPLILLLLVLLLLRSSGSAMICKKGFAPHTGARAIPPTLLDTRAHEKSILRPSTSTRQTCEKAPLPAQYTVFRGIHPSSVELE